MPFHLWSADDRRTRRDFLGTIATGVTLAGAATTARSAPPKPDDGDWFALVSDTHIAGRLDAICFENMMARNLKAVVDDILAADRRPKGVLFNGDLAFLHGRAEDYAGLLKVIEPLRAAKIPLHFLLGNHDDRDNFRAGLKDVTSVASELDDKLVGSIQALGHRFVMLDSLDELNATPGKIGEAQLSWLARHLDADDSIPTLIFMHHNLRTRTIQGIVDDKEMFEVVRGRRCVKAILFGHTHTWTYHREAGLKLINLPAVAYPFLKVQPLGYCQFSVVDDRPTFRLRALMNNTTRDGEVWAMKWRSS